MSHTSLHLFKISSNISKETVVVMVSMWLLPLENGIVLSVLIIIIHILTPIIHSVSMTLESLIITSEVVRWHIIIWNIYNHHHWSFLVDGGTTSNQEYCDS